MKRFFVLAILVIVVSILIAGISKADPLPKDGTCYSSVDPTINPVTNTCDNDDATRAFWNNALLPVDLTINLTAAFLIDHVNVNVGYDSSYELQTLDNGVWTTHATHTSGFFSNDSVSFDTPTCADAIRLHYTAGPDGFVDLYEIWPDGTTCATPPSVSTDPATAITCGLATLNGNLTSVGTSANVTVGFLYGINPVLSSGTNVTVGITNITGTFSLDLTSLAQGVFYYFRAWANGTDGYSQGSILNFQSAVCPTICGADPYAPANLWTVGFLIGLAIVFAGMAVIRFPPLWVLSGIAVLFISFYSFCMAGFVPAGLSVVIGVFVILQGIPAKDFEG